MSKKITFPRKGKIKATGEIITLVGQEPVAGIPCFRVKLRGSNVPVHYAKSAVVVLGE